MDIWKIKTNTTHQNPDGPNQSKAAITELTVAGMPIVANNSNQSYLPKVTLLLNATVTKADIAVINTKILCAFAKV